MNEIKQGIGFKVTGTLTRAFVVPSGKCAFITGAPREVRPGQVVAWQLTDGGLAEVVRIGPDSSGRVLATTSRYPSFGVTRGLGKIATVLVADVGCEPTDPATLYGKPPATPPVVEAPRVKCGKDIGGISKGLRCNREPGHENSGTACHWHHERGPKEWIEAPSAKPQVNHVVAHAAGCTCAACALMKVRRSSEQGPGISPLFAPKCKLPASSCGHRACQVPGGVFVPRFTDEDLLGRDL